MTTPNSHEHFAELAAGYALHALEPGDEQVFLAHLAACAACELAVAEHTETLGHLAYAAEPADLPAEILQGIRSQVGPGRPADRSTEPSPLPLDLGAARAHRRPSTVPAWLGIAAAVAMVLSLGVWNIALRHDNSRADHRSALLAAAVSALSGDAKQRIELKDPDGRPVAIAVIRGSKTVSLVVDGLAPNNRANSTYVLWQKGSDAIVHAIGTFDVRRTGVDYVASLPLARNVVGIEGFAVTREPGRRAPSVPGSFPVADGALPA